MKPRPFLPILVGLFLSSVHAFAQYVPTSYEQYQLELVNRARANPGAEVTRLSSLTWGNTGAPVAPSLNEGLPPGTITNTLRQPLAFNPNLIKSARDYSALLLAYNAFTHYFGGTSPTSRMTSAGYSFSGSWGNAENLSWTGSTGPMSINTTTTETLHNNLFVDGDVYGRGHRLDLLDAEMKEIGIGLVYGTGFNGGAGGQTFNSVMTTQDFAYETGSPFITGVVYRDTDANNFYSPGEGVGGVTVTATPTGGGAALTATTWSSGGYSLRVPAGSYTMAFTGAFTTANTLPSGSVSMGSTNQKVDAQVIGNGVTVPAQLTNPANGTTFASTSAQFNWNTGTGATGYALWVGSTPGGTDVYASLEGTNLSKSLTLPGDGRTLYVTLFSLINGSYENNKYTFTAYAPPAPVKAKVVSPTNGSALSTTSLNLQWDAGVGVSQYYLFVGRSPDSYDVYVANQGTSTSANVTVPATNSRIYVTLWSLINGTWHANRYYYVSPPAIAAQLTSHVSGDTLASATTTLNWDTGTGVSGYVLWVGTQPKGYDLVAIDAGTSLSRNITTPVDGRIVYVTLWSLINGGYQSNEYWFRTAATAAQRPAAITNIANGTQLTSTTQTFDWDAGIGASQYALWIGTGPGAYDLYASLETGSNRTRTVSGLPANGGKIYVTLYSKIGSSWVPAASYFVAMNGQPAQITTPANGSTLANQNLALTWAPSAAATRYYLWIGRSPGGYDLYAADEGLGLAHTVSVPVDGTPVYVTLWSLIDGKVQSTTSAFKAANTAAGSKRAFITSPANSTTLPGAQTTFTWAGGSGVTQYALWIGSTPSGYDLYAALEGLNTSQQVTLPTDGRPLYVTLWSFIGGTYLPSHHQFTAATLPPSIATLTAPVNGSSFTSTSANFTWTTATGATQYALWVGSTPGGYDLYAALEGTNSTELVTSLPNDGRPVYVKLWSLLGGAWQGSESVFDAWQKP